MSSQGFYPEAAWAPLAGQARTATNLPVVYVGRVTSVATAERILAEGNADLVGFARAAIADPDLVVQVAATGGHRRDPSVHRAPGVHRPPSGRGPAVRVWHQSARRAASTRGVRPRCRAEIGAGGRWRTGGNGVRRANGGTRPPCARCWERAGELGGQLAVAARLRMNRQLTATGSAGRRHGWHGPASTVQLGQDATGEDVLGCWRGGRGRSPPARRPAGPTCPGADLPFVVSATDAVTAARASRPAGRGDLPGRPLVTACGCRPSRRRRSRGDASCTKRLAPSPLVGKYTIGAVMARLDDGDVKMVPMTRLVGDRDPAGSPLAHCYSGRRWTVDGRRLGRARLRFRSLSTSCTTPCVRDTPSVHLLGDAFAPRRMVVRRRVRRMSWHERSTDWFDGSSGSEERSRRDPALPNTAGESASREPPPVRVRR